MTHRPVRPLAHPLGAIPAGVSAAFRHADATLRLTGDRPRPSPATCLGLLLIGATCYGLTSPASSLAAGDWPFLFATAIKAPLVVLATTLLCLPAFAAAAVATGLGPRFRELLGRVARGQAVTGLALASLAPASLVLATARPGERIAVLGHLACFAVAAAAGQVVIWRRERDRPGRTMTERWVLVAWFALYAFVGVQTGWMLRPFVLSPGEEPRVLSDEPFTNGYEKVWGLILGNGEAHSHSIVAGGLLEMS